MPTKQRMPKGPITEDPLTGKRLTIPAGLEGLEPLWVDERKELIGVYAKDCLNQTQNGKDVRDSSKFMAFWGDPDEKPATYRRQGYEPVMDPETKEQVTHRGDPLWKRPRAMTVKHMTRAAKHSAAMVEDTALAKEDAQTREGFFVPRESEVPA